MSIRLALAVTILVLCAGACFAARPTGAETFPSLTPPVRLARVDFYLDGGTVGFVVVGAQAETLRGGFDGRMVGYPIRTDDRGRLVGPISTPHRHHCYVGSEYPTGPGTRLLPLWGGEERALVRLLTQVIEDTLSTDQVQQLLGTSSAMDLPHDISVDLWHFVCAVDFRRQTHDALDHGLLCSPRVALHYFGMVPPVRADSIGLDPVSGRFVIRIRDAQASTRRVSFPASPDSIMSSSSTSWPVHWRTEETLVGDTQDRMLLTLIAVAIGDDADSLAALQSRDYLTQYQQNEAVLRILLRMRSSRILEADAKD